jgi:hypothetical protein
MVNASPAPPPVLWHTSCTKQVNTALEARETTDDMQTIPAWVAGIDSDGEDNDRRKIADDGALSTLKATLLPPPKASPQMGGGHFFSGASGQGSGVRPNPQTACQQSLGNSGVPGAPSGLRASPPLQYTSPSWPSTLRRTPTKDAIGDSHRFPITPTMDSVGEIGGCPQLPTSPIAQGDSL